MVTVITTTKGRCSRAISTIIKAAKAAQRPCLVLDAAKLAEIGSCRSKEWDGEKYRNYALIVPQSLLPQVMPYYNADTSKLFGLMRMWGLFNWEILIVVEELGRIKDRQCLQPCISRILPVESVRRVFDNVLPDEIPAGKSSL